LAEELSAPYLAPPQIAQLMKSSRRNTTSIIKTSIVNASADVSHWQCIFATFFQEAYTLDYPHFFIFQNNSGQSFC
jgi:hypothetical protein